MRPAWFLRAAALAGLGLAPACGSDDTSAVPSCADGGTCPAGLVCTAEGTCESASGGSGGTGGSAAGGTGGTSGGCLVNSDCGAQQECYAGACVPLTGCANSLDCPSGMVCVPGLDVCGQCASSLDCVTEACSSDRHCRGACDSDVDCTGLRQLCNKTLGLCFDPSSGGA